MASFTAGEVIAMLALIEATSIGSIVWASRNLATKDDVINRIENKLEKHKQIHHSTRNKND